MTENEIGKIIVDACIATVKDRCQRSDVRD